MFLTQFKHGYYRIMTSHSYAQLPLKQYLHLNVRLLSHINVVLNFL